jgi:hypothetical protein
VVSSDIVDDDDDDDRIMIPSKCELYLVTSCITFNGDWI